MARFEAKEEAATGFESFGQFAEQTLKRATIVHAGELLEGFTTQYLEQIKWGLLSENGVKQARRSAGRSNLTVGANRASNRYGAA